MFQTALLLLSIQTGDVLIQSAQCSLCSLIELEEGAPYSHVGIAVVDQNKNISVLNAWSKVEAISFDEFISHRKPSTPTLVLRPLVKNLLKPLSENNLLIEFKQNFEGNHYDSAFLWSNHDELGEKYYCSELVTKLLNVFFKKPLMPKPMHYTHAREKWIEYFKGTPPDGLPGISPADIAKSDLFTVVEEIN